MDVVFTDVNNKVWTVPVPIVTGTTYTMGMAPAPLATSSGSLIGMLTVTLAKVANSVQYTLSISGNTVSSDTIAARYLIARL